MSNTVAHLNNEHRWTRERIADFVEQEERSLDFPLRTESQGRFDKVGV